MIHRVEIAGGIGSGKTTLLTALGGQFRGIYEDHTINPFWKAFYADPSSYAFETEIAFLLQHYHFAKVGGIASRRVIALDHSFELDMAYAEVGLDGSRKEIFRSIYREILNELGPPRALVYVVCRPEEAARRISERGRSFETGLPSEFLFKLQSALEVRVAELADETPIIRVDSEQHDLRSPGTWLAELRSDLDGHLS